MYSITPIYRGFWGEKGHGKSGIAVNREFSAYYVIRALSYTPDLCHVI